MCPTAYHISSPTCAKSLGFFANLAQGSSITRCLSNVGSSRNDPVPLWIRNAPTQLLKDLDYGKDYRYAHEYYKDMQIDDAERPPSKQIQEYLPENLKGRHYYEPGHQGKEASINKWLEKRREKE